MKTIFCRLPALALSATIGLAGCVNQPGINPAPGEFGNLPRESTVELGGGVTMLFALIPAGSFQMGSEKSQFEDERPVHQVTITRPFYLGKYEVTQEQWQSVMGGNPSSFKGPKLPVEHINWNDCQDFLARLKERVKGCDFNLPTAAQWEYACRAGGAGDYSFGNDERKLDQYAWYSGNAGGQTHPVGKKKPNAWGLYDMHGNVWEWCREAYLPPYAPGAVSDPVGTSTGTFLLLRGGAWNSPPVFVRSAFNGNGPPGVRNNCLGLRVMMLAGAAR